MGVVILRGDLSSQRGFIKFRSSVTEGVLRRISSVLFLLKFFISIWGVPLVPTFPMMLHQHTAASPKNRLLIKLTTVLSLHRTQSINYTAPNQSILLTKSNQHTVPSFKSPRNAHRLSYSQIDRRTKIKFQDAPRLSHFQIDRRTNRPSHQNSLKSQPHHIS